MEKSILGITFAVISTASWALCSLIFKKLGEKLEPIGMTFIKSSLSVFFLFIAILLTGTNFIISKEVILPVMASGIIGIAIGDSLFFASLNRLSPLLLSIILFVGPDLFNGIFGLIFLGEMPSLINWVGIVVILIGLSFFIFPLNIENNEKARTTFWGLLFAVLSLICSAYSMVIIKPVFSSVSTITATMYRMLSAGIVLFIFGIISKQLPAWKNRLNEKNYNIKLISTIALATFGGFWMSLSAIKYCQLIIASTIMTLEPLFIIIFMVILFKYKPKLKEYLGLVFTIAGIIIMYKGAL